MLAHTRFSVGARAGLILVCVGVLAGCGPRRPDSSEARPATAAQPAASAIPPGAAAYVVDAERSVVTLRVYRAGRLARLGHNHVITSATETGYAWTSGAPATSGFELRVPVAELVVDDPAARAAAGEDFPGALPDSAREGTRRNMLRPEVLDGERYPQIVVRADSLGGTWEVPTVTANVTLRDQTRRIDVPLDIARESAAIVARGTFSILQSDFGITPFSVGGGAIQVADAVEIAFEIHAVRR
jgi:polyisoprenoid-binding protein YceI